MKKTRPNAAHLQLLFSKVLPHISVVNFTNILWAAFALIYLRHKKALTNGTAKLFVWLLYEKAAISFLVKWTSGVEFINICAQIFHAQDPMPFFWQTAFGKWHTYFGKFWPNFSLTALLVKLRIFRQMPCVSNFLLGRKSLVKSTLGGSA